MKADPKSVLLGAAVTAAVFLLSAANDGAPHAPSVGPIKEYRVVSGPRGEIDAAVSQAIADGWTLYETPFVDYGTRTAQAMIKR